MRLEGQAKAGEYPAPVSAVRAVASMLQAPHPERTTLADPFGSDGRTLNLLAQALGVPSSGRYLAELKPANVAQAHADGVGHVVACDSFSELRASHVSMSLVWNNSPFDWTNGGLHERVDAGTREELRALRLVLSPSKLNLLIPGGIHVVVAPEDIMLREDMRTELAKWHDDLTVWTFPVDERPFNEVVVIGVKRAQARRDADEIAAVMAVLAAQIHAADPLAVMATPIYTVPATTRMGAIVWRQRNASAQQDVARAIVTTGGIWTAAAYTHARAGLRQFVAPPLAPFNAEQAAMMVASGKFNNRLVTLDGEPFLVKGFTAQHEQKTTTTAATTTQQVTTTETITVPHPMIAVRNVATGAVTIYDGTDAVMQFVSKNADAFLQMAQDAAPAGYNPATPDPRVWAILNTITSVSGRKPRGADTPGLVEQQKHAAAALVAGLTQPHPLTHTPLKGVVAALEQRCGKSPTALGIAEVLRQIDPPKGRRRAYTVVLPAPRLVVGDKRQIADALSGKGSLPAWYALWQDMLPHWTLAVLETPADVGAFFRSAAQHPDTPHVAFVPLSMLALGPGWEVMNAPVSPTAGRRDRFANREAEQAALAVLHRGADADDDALDTPSAALPVGVSLRTQRRDAVLKPAYRPRQHGDLRCPDCGRVATSPEDGSSITGITEMQDATCAWCGGRFAGWTRTTQAKDTRVAAFRTWQDDFARAADGSRLIPWGDRPTSNPRVPLAWLFSRRYKGRIDLLVIDEIHKAKGDGTAIGDAMFWVADAARKVVYLTGTVFGGNALDTFNIYWSIANPVLRRTFAFGDRSRFVDVMGVKKITVTETTQATGAGVFNGRHSRRTKTETLPGLTINLLEMVLTQTVMRQLTDMGFPLVPLTERKVLLDMPADVDAEYADAVAVYKAWMKQRRFRAASSGMQMLWQLPYQPHDPKAMRYVPRDPETGEELPEETYTPAAIAPRALPHHEWLAQYIVAERRNGRRVLVYATHTGEDNLLPNVQEWTLRVAREQHGMPLKGIQLYSDRDSEGTQVASGARDAWFRQKALEDYDVVFANPQCLDVGISLLDWSSIVFLEPHYSAFVVSQAMMRAWGPMQDQPCEVVFLAYRQTVSHAALGILAQKLAAMAALKGSVAKALQGIAEFSGAMSVFEAIAEIVANGTPLEEPAMATLEAPPATPLITVARQLTPAPRDLFTLVPVAEPARKGRTAPATPVTSQQWAMAL